MDPHDHIIPRQEWPEFFQAFSRIHEGWLVTLEILDPSLGDQVIAEGFSLKGITVDSRRLVDGDLSIFLTKNDENLTHMVAAPTEIRLKRTPEGADEALQIHSADGPTTLLRFRASMVPEEVDGILPQSIK